MVLLELTAIIFGLFLMAYAEAKVSTGLKLRRQKKALESADLNGDVDEGGGCEAVEGTVVPEETLPIGPAESVVVQADVWEYRTDDSLETTDQSDSHGVPFLIDTGHRKVAVDPDGIDVEATADRTVEETVEPGENPTGVVGQYSRYRDLDPIPQNCNREYEIEWVEPGDKVSLFGDIERRGSRMVAVAGEGAYFVSDEDPETLYEQREHALSKALVKGGAVGAVGLVATLGGAAFLLV